MNSSLKLILATCMMLLMGCAASQQSSNITELQQQVRDAEQAFAKSMAERDHQAFMSFLSEEALFFSGSSVLRGKQQIAAAWKPYYDKPAAPFSWEPELVEVLDSGTLALSSGPVRDPGGALVGTFTSIWQHEADGRWRVIFDKGNKACD